MLQLFRLLLLAVITTVRFQAFIKIAKSPPSHTTTTTTTTITDDDDEDVFTMMEQYGFTVKELKCISHPEAQFKSYKLAVPRSDFSKLFDANLWLKGIFVRTYWSQKPGSKWFFLLDFNFFLFSIVLLKLTSQYRKIDRAVAAQRVLHQIQQKILQ